MPSFCTPILSKPKPKPKTEAPPTQTNTEQPKGEQAPPPPSKDDVPMADGEAAAGEPVVEEVQDEGMDIDRVD